MKLTFQKITCLVLLSLCLCLPGAPKAQAAGVTVAPSFKDIYIDSERPVETTVSLTNTSTVELTFAVEVTDFGASDDSGGISLNVGDSYKYGLKDYVAMSANEVTIGPKQKGTVTALISNIANMSPGGHYGAITFTLKDDSSGKIPVKQTVASLLFVGRKGGDGAKLSTQKLSFQPSLFRLPGEAEIVISNEGNVHATPSGSIAIRDPRGREIYTGQVNSTNGKILPETARKFVLGINTGSVSLPGRYSLQAVVDGQTSTQHFFMFPLPSLIVSGLLLVSVVMAFIIFRKRRTSPRRKGTAKGKPSMKK